MILNICVRQINKYSFLVKDITTDQTYSKAGVDMSLVTAAKLVFINTYDDSEVELDIFSSWNYLLGDGITINITSFPNGKLGVYDYFPDYIYQVKVVYTYKGTEYTSSKTIGFKSIIANTVYQQTQQEDWKLSLKCRCDCTKYSSTIRKFDYLDGLDKASKNCLINQYIAILLALYKLAGLTHEYAS